MKLLLSFIILISLSLVEQSDAEPWLANRFAKNCAACHAPGRYNLKPSKRRCTLSCQGCHVNPNGGGLRSNYGLWNQQRWLKSFFNKKTLKNKKLPAPSKNQHYVRINKDKKKRSNPLKRNATTVKHVTVNEKKYDKYADNFWKKNMSLKKFKTHIPKDDPYNLERTQMVTASGDLRYIYGSLDKTTSNNTGSTNTSKDLSFFMNVDAGVRVRPIRKYLSAVYEARSFTTSTDASYDESLGGSAMTRSAYLMVDELPFNTYVMMGLFRPMFGHYNPDHNALAQEVSEMGYGATFKAIGIGTAPNVPYFNFNLIQSSEGSSVRDESGFVANAGLRFVTMGASANLSYWSTEKADKTKKDMISLSLGGFFMDRYVVNFEYLMASKKSPLEDSGTVMTLETKTKLWRETYALFNYANSNVAKDLGVGSANELLIGAKGFIYPGMEAEFSYITREHQSIVDSVDTNVKEQLIQLQTHLYF